MAGSGRLVDYLGSGPIASRPASLTLVADSVGFWWATDTTTLSTWDGTSWADVSGGGGGGMTNPMTSAGDLIVGGTAGAPARLGIGTNGQVLTLVSGVPTWVTVSGTGDMAVATYDPAAIAQQVLGTTATQTITNKDLTSGTNTFPTLNQDTTGNAATADALATARTIAGQSFDGTGNISIPIESLSDVTVTSVSNGQALTWNGTAWVNTTLGGGSGTVTSVGLSLPDIFSVSDSPVTANGTLTGALATQSANTVFAGPSSGSAAAPTFRTLVAADYQSATIPVSAVNATGTPSSTTYLRGDGTWETPAGGGSGGADGVNTQTGTAYTFVLGDNGFTVVGANSGAIAFTIPANADVAFPIGAKVAYTQGGVGQITVSGDTGVTVHDANGNTTGAQWDGGVAEKIGTDEWQLWNGPALGPLASASDAPSDGTPYARQSGSWVSATGGGSGGGITAMNEQTGTSYTLVLADATEAVRCTNSGAITLTIPPNSSAAIPVLSSIPVFQGGAGVVTVTAGAGVTFESPNGVATTAIGDFRVAFQRATNIWVIG